MRCNNTTLLIKAFDTFLKYSKKDGIEEKQKGKYLGNKHKVRSNLDY
jgi:hypothetical protein